MLTSITAVTVRKLAHFFYIDMRDASKQGIAEKFYFTSERLKAEMAQLCTVCE